MKKPDSTLAHFIQFETLAGICLVLALALALIAANSTWAVHYDRLIQWPLTLHLGEHSLRKPLILWVNDGLMAIFFMLLALEIKRECLTGHLADRSQLALPIVCAIGGIVLPILIFYFFNQQDSTGLAGWPIPTTTDIAFALGVVALLGPRVPLAAKVLLVAFSIVDDVIAVIIIAVAYTHGIAWGPLAYAAGLAFLMLVGNRLGIRSLLFYLGLGLLLWFFVLKSGVHATVAGILVGLLMPMRQGRGATSLGEQLERTIHPWVSFLIIPLFVFVNGGVHFSGVTLGTFTHPTALGIILGLFIGKGLGVFLFARLAITLRLAALPAGMCNQSLLGIGSLSGIGFTMSLFFANLAFETPSYLLIAKQAILLGSALSCLVGCWLFINAYRLRNQQP